jgi:DNA-binding MarR family transcriptional regulator
MSSSQGRPVEVAGSLSFLVNKLAQLAGRGMTEALAPLGVGPKEAGILAAVAQNGPLPQHRLGELLLIDRTTMVVCIDRLEELDLVERTGHPTDRRIFLVRLTPKGAASTLEAQQRLEAAEEQLLGPLSLPERGIFRALLYRLVEDALHPDVRLPGGAP